MQSLLRCRGRKRKGGVVGGGGGGRGLSVGEIMKHRWRLWGVGGIKTVHAGGRGRVGGWAEELL